MLLVGGNLYDAVAAPRSILCGIGTGNGLYSFYVETVHQLIDGLKGIAHNRTVQHVQRFGATIKKLGGVP